MRSRALAFGTAVAVALGVILWLIYYWSADLSYARLDPSVRIERFSEDPDRLAIVYSPLSTGRLGFRRVAADRETELLDRVAPARDGTEQRFEWRWSGVKRGDILKLTHRQGWSLATKELEVPERPPTPRLGDALLTGEIVNAINNRPVPAAQVRVVGTKLRTTSDAEGRFQLEDLPSGPVAIEISADRFSAEQIERELSSGTENRLRVVLSPGMEAGQMRVVLTWGKRPKDLDAHLTGPLPNQENFHVYFNYKGDLKSKEFVNLDVDDRDGEGPETITVLGVLPGKYSYFVHDYSNRNDLQDSSLAQSGAEVRVYQGGQTYRFRANQRSVGNVWHVCEIDVTSAGAKVRKIDQYESKRLKDIAMGTVVLLMDVSGSMVSLIGEAKRAAGGFLQAVPFEAGAKAGLVRFGETTDKLHDITDDGGTLIRAIKSLRPGGPTPLTRGLAIAHRMLQKVSGPRAMVVFTDGEPDSPGEALNLGRRIKRDGVVIWAIGTRGADMNFLRRLTTAPNKATFANPESLRKVFSEMAGKIYAPVDE